MTGMGIDRKDLRFLLSQYVTDKIRYSDQSTSILERLRDPQRSYFAHKAVKDYIILTKKLYFTEVDIQKMFKSRSLVNYLNDLILNIIDRYLEMVYDFEVEYDPMLAISDPYLNH